jgi:hypothetical protein
MASGHVNRIKRPDTWLHRPMLQNVKKVLANPEPSHALTSPLPWRLDQSSIANQSQPSCDRAAKGR